MSTLSIERSLVAAAAVLLVVAGIRWRVSEPRAPDPASVVAPALKLAMAATDSALEGAEDITVANDPFRLSNSPPDSRYDPIDETAAANTGHVPPPVRPSFALKAIVGGPPWHAVIEGFPGQPAGTVTRQGAQFDRLVVRAVTRDSVIIQGPDTVWVLRFGKNP